MSRGVLSATSDSEIVGDSNVDVSIVKLISKEDIRLIYKFGKVIGAGNFGTVRLASKHNSAVKKFAIKSIPRSKVENDLDLLE